MDPDIYVKDYSLIGGHIPTINWMFGVSSILRHLQRGESAHAKARAALLLAAGDQMSLEHGSWNLAWPLTLLPVPPYQAMSTHVPQRNPAVMDEPFSPLLEGTWVAAHMAWMRDSQLILQKRKEFKGKGGGKDKEKGKGE